jgi:hypothetical protein
MCHAFLSTAKFWSLLLRIDEDLAAEVRAAGCAACGGVLHSARYPRKPRGIERCVLGEEYGRRLSFCCDRDGCRRRATPPSVRFLGRRVFLGAVVVLVTALSAGLTGRRVAALQEQFGVSVRTLRRWRGWWQKDFVASTLWARLRARLATPIKLAELPGALLERCAGVDRAGQLTHLLRLLAPLSTRSSALEGC